METSGCDRILVVDDAGDNRILLQKILTRQCFEVYCCADGNSAIAALPSFKPDLILLDVVMEEMDGFETCAQIKANPKYEDIPVIFVTAADERHHISKGFRAGAVDYITKPINATEVLARVSCHLKLSHQTRQLKEAATNFETILKGITVPIFTVSPSGEFQFINPACENILGYSLAHLKQHTFFDLLSSPYKEQIQQSFGQHSRFSSLKEYGRPHEIKWQPPDGSQSALEVSICPVSLDQTYFVVSIHDITSQKNREQVLEQQAMMDALTRLPNRRMLFEFLTQELAHQQRHPRPLLVMFCDIDYFKKYNDHYGHLDGDQTLKKVGEALQQCVRKKDDIVARYGGEEFVIVITGVAQEIAEKISQNTIDQVAALDIPHTASSVATHVTLSAGAIWLPSASNQTSHSLLEHADKVLYQAKESGRNQLCFEQVTSFSKAAG
jgi:diguanylate cyclase (GGDEF)-like protein/PAS domain S-box-containing protein